MNCKDLLAALLMAVPSLLLILVIGLALFPNVDDSSRRSVHAKGEPAKVSRSEPKIVTQKLMRDPWEKRSFERSSKSLAKAVICPAC